MNDPREAAASSSPKDQRVNKYGRNTLSDKQIAAEQHRKRVGGLWDEVGQLQFHFLVRHGLTPDSYLLDVGCGALRGGIHFVRYLEPAHYFGIDVNASLLRAGLEHEIPQAGLSDRLPAEHLHATDRFECDFGVSFDFALAVSLFTHLPLNHIRLCLYRLANVMQPGGRFFASFFEMPQNHPFDQPRGKRYPERDPYHYRPSDLEWAATSVAAWDFRYIGDWDHPRGQRMVEFRKRTPARARRSLTSATRQPLRRIRSRMRSR